MFETLVIPAAGTLPHNSNIIHPKDRGMINQMRNWGWVQYGSTSHPPAYYLRRPRTYNGEDHTALLEASEADPEQETEEVPQDEDTATA